MRRRLRINGEIVSAEPKETVLGAALRGGLSFPHRCRVGGCGTCKCRVVEGKVHEQTDTAYLLSENEIHSGIVLACQSIPVTDLTVELPGVRISRLPKGRDSTLSPSISASATVRERVTGLFHYLKYFSFHVIGLLSLVSILRGGAGITWTLLGVLAIYIVGDAVCGDDTSTPKFRHPKILTAQLWLALPLLFGIVWCSVWSVSSRDPFGFGAWIGQLAHVDLLALRSATTSGHRISQWILTGLMIGMLGTITAHELTHRTWDCVSLGIGRWLLAFSFDTSFAIEHVYGHHRYVSTTEDPATAPRGRNVYLHIVLSTFRGNLSAWNIEKERLKKRRRSVFSWHNAVLRGFGMSLLLVLGTWFLFGPAATFFFVCSALWGKALLEIVNYMEHYGIVRAPEAPVKPRHSWNTNRRISSWSLFNLTRHSHHHAQGEVAYHDLRPYPNAPRMLSGYLSTILIAMIPPLWHHLMVPKIQDWDERFANDEERVLAKEANARSGLRKLTRI